MSNFGTYEEIKNELIRRSKVIENALIQETEDIRKLQFSVGMTGSRILFTGHLAPIGFPETELPRWMTESEAVAIMSKDDFFSDKYDDIFESLFWDLYNKYGVDSEDEKYRDESFQNPNNKFFP